MSDFGISLKTALGGILVDSKYKNYELLQDGSVSIDGLNGGSIPLSLQAGIIPLVALQISSTTVTFRGFTFSGSAITSARFIAESNVTVAYKVFVPAVDRPVSGYGLAVFGPDGKVLYDTNYRYMVLKQVSQLNASDIAYHSQTSSPPFYLVGSYGGYREEHWHVDVPTQEYHCWFEFNPSIGQYEYVCGWVPVTIRYYYSRYFMKGLRASASNAIAVKEFKVDEYASAGVSTPLVYNGYVYNFYVPPAGQDVDANGGGVILLVEVQK